MNANVGECFGIWSRGDDEVLWPHVSTANVACGFHAGDAPTMRRSVARAVEAGVRVCGLVGYRDLAGFGNRFLDVDPGDLGTEVIYQLGALDGLALVAGGNMAAVRLAGALGTTAARHRAQAEAVMAAIAQYDPRLVLLTGSRALADLAVAAGLEVEREAPSEENIDAAVAAARKGAVDTIHVTPATVADVRRQLPADPAPR